MRDPYHTLGIERGATTEDIKQAYRKLAARHHPDRGGDTARFQEIQQAYDALTNPQPNHAQQPHPGTNPFGAGGFGFSFAFDDFFNMFQQQTQHRRNHVKITLWTDLRDVATGGRRAVSLGTSQGVQTVEIEIPLGINDGDHVQYAGLGPGGTDLVVEFRIKPDPTWERQGLNLVCERTLIIWDLILGTELHLSDVTGQRLETQIPPMTQPGTMMRLKGRGLRDRNGNQGDCLIRVFGQIPVHIDPELVDCIKQHR